MGRALLWVLVVALAAAAWWYVVPAGAGGRTSYVIVNGHSMEPLLRTGDLAVARTQSSYRRGDLVVVSVLGGSVIHRIVGGTPATGWHTKGDNNSWVDPWVVHRSNIAGRYEFHVGGAGSVLTWITRHPLGFAALSALALLVLIVPWRRRRIDPSLAEALATAQREPRRAGRTNAEYGVLALTSTVAALSLFATLAATTRGAATTASGLTALGAFLVTGTLTVVLLLGLFDGRGANEPRRSQLALSGRLYRVVSFPSTDGAPAPTASALQLRRIAEQERIPVLHHVDATTGQDQYLVITSGRSTFLWTPRGPGVAPGAPKDPTKGELVSRVA